MIKTIDPIFFSCYYAFFEYYIAFRVYGNTITDINKILYNIFHNLGKIYDLTEEAVYRIIDWED